MACGDVGSAYANGAFGLEKDLLKVRNVKAREEAKHLSYLTSLAHLALAG